MNRLIFRPLALRFFKNNSILKAIFYISGTVSLASYMAIISWRKWPDILIDFGRELYVPWQLAQEAVLYRDIAYFNGPFSPYFNSLLFKIFDPSLKTLMVFNFFIISIITLLIFLIFKEIADELTAWILMLTFLSLFAFSQYVAIGNYNFVTPYSHELIHGILFSFLAIYFFLNYLKRKNLKSIISIGISVGIVFLTKPEIFLAIFICMFIGFFWTSISKQSFKNFFVKNFLFLFFSFAIPSILFCMYFAKYSSMYDSLAKILTPYFILLNNSILSSPFYLSVTGFGEPLMNLKKMISSLMWLLSGIFLFIVMPTYVTNKVNDKKLKILATFLILLIMFFSIPFLKILIPWFMLIRPLPIIIIFIIIFTWKKLHTNLATINLFNRLIITHIFAWFSLVLLFKIFLNIHVYHYGFALAMPATIFSLYILTFLLADKIGDKFHNRIVSRIFSLAFVLIFIFIHVNFSSSIYKLKDYKVGIGKNEFITWNVKVFEQGIFVNEALKKIEEIIKPNENFIVLPEGVMLNFLSKRANPTPYINFMPPEINIYGEDTIINSFEKSKPDYILFANKDTSEYGHPFFGKDYGEKIYQWVQENYKELMTIGNEPFSGNGFGIKILKRIDRPLEG